MTINERFIKISSRSPIAEDLELGDNVTLIIRGSIVKRDEKDLQDGTKDTIAILKPIDTQIVSDQDVSTPDQ